MAGRYGQDELSKFLLIVSLAILVAGMFAPQWIVWFGIGLLAWNYYRIFSRNTGRRMRENYVYLRFQNKITGWFKARGSRLKQRKAYRFYKCPSCAQTLRVPRKLGKITITCPKCNCKITRKT
jgi:hypothetical protein